MKKTLILSLFLFGFFFVGFSSPPQGVSFDYDACGNRVSRVPNQITISRINTVGSGVYYDSTYGADLSIEVSASLSKLEVNASEYLSKSIDSVVLYDKLGKLLYKKTLGALCQVDLSSLPSGNYRLEFLSEDKNVDWSLEIQ